MILKRLFYGLRQTYISRILKLKGTPISKTEVKNLVKKYAPEYRVDFDQSEDGELLSSFSSIREKRIHMESPLDLETILHELGHVVENNRSGSNNDKFTKSPTYNRESYMGMEIEAWEWAEAHHPNWGKNQELYKKMCLDGYRAVKTSNLPV